MPLSSLPNELLAAIADCILPSQNDLNALAQINHRLYAAVNPQLYRHQITQQRGSALLWTAENGKTASCQRLLQEGANADDTRGKRGRTPLTLAAANGQESILGLLLAHHVNPDIRAEQGTTPLGWAALMGHETIVRILLATDSVDPNSRSCGAETPLSLAVCHDRVAVVRILLAVPGIDPNSPNSIGWSPLASNLDRYRNDGEPV